jgi:hypothetical protein
MSNARAKYLFMCVHRNTTKHLLTCFSDFCKTNDLVGIISVGDPPLKHGEEAAVIGSAAALADDDE